MYTHDIRSGTTNKHRVKVKHDFLEVIPKESE